MSRLLGCSNSKHKRKQHFCLNCWHGFHSEESRDNHFEYCKDNEAVRIEMPKEGSFVEFHDGQNQFKVPFIINQHIPSGFCVYSKFAYGKVENPSKLYRGKNYVKVFCNYIENKAKRLYHMFPEKPMKPLSSEQWREFNRARKCHLKEFQELNPKVRDHCHYTGQYRGPAIGTAI